MWIWKSTCCESEVDIVSVPRRDEHDDKNIAICLDCGDECEIYEVEIEESEVQDDSGTDSKM